MAAALGVKFLDASRRELPPGGAALTRLAQIDTSGMDARLKDAEIVVACDVDNPLCGPRGASAVYGPQKGATPEMVTDLDAALRNFAEFARKATYKDAAETPGAGAAGGLGAGLLYFTNAVLRPGVEIVIEATGLDELIRTADSLSREKAQPTSRPLSARRPWALQAWQNATESPSSASPEVWDKAPMTFCKHGVDALISVTPRQ